MQSPEYIEPLLKVYANLSELLEADGKKGNLKFHSAPFKNRLIDSLLNEINKMILIGKPGHGKSELLRRMYNEVTDKGKKSAFFDLGSFKEKDLNTLFEERSDYYFFDALDELSPQLYNRLFKSLIKFCKKNKDKHIFISCRVHDASNKKSDLMNLEGFNYFEILPFNNPQVAKYLKNAGLDQELQEYYLMGNEYQIPEVMKVPRYLSETVSIIKREKLNLEEIRNWKRVDYFERFVYVRLKAKTDKYSINKYTIAKRVLEKLALVMEIYQTNEITRDEFTTFLDGIPSNTHQVFLSKWEIDEFIELVLQTKGQQGIEFHNTEFQEYLAAKELLRLSGNPQAIFDVIVQNQFGHIDSNWYNVIKFILELEGKLILPLLDFFEQNPFSIAEEEILDLLEYVNADTLSKKESAILFEKIFNLWQKNERPFWKVNNPGNFYQPENYELFDLTELLHTRDNDRQINKILEFMNVILCSCSFTPEQSEDWKKLLLKILQDKKLKNLHGYALYVLAQFKDIVYFEKLYRKFVFAPKSYKEIFTTCCQRINPNCNFSFKVFMKVIDVGIIDIALEGISKTTDEKLLVDFFKRIKGKKDILGKIFNSNHALYDIQIRSLFSNVNKITNYTILPYLKSIFKILLEQDLLRNNEKVNIYEFAKSIHKKDDKYFINTFSFASLQYWNNLEEILVYLLTPNNFYLFISVLEKKSPLSIDNIANSLYNIKKKKDSKSKLYPWQAINEHLAEQMVDFNKTYHLSLSLFEDHYQVFERDEFNVISQKELDQIKENRLYQSFKNQLYYNRWHNEFHTLKTYVHKYNILKNYLTDQDSEKLKSMVYQIKDYKLDPEASTYTLTKSSRITKNPKIQYSEKNYEIYLIAAFYLKILKNLKIPRRKILFTMLACFNLNGVKFENYIWSNLIKKITPADEDILINIINSRKDDFIYWTPTIIASISKHYKLKRITDIIRLFVIDPKIESSQRIQIFKTLLVDNTTKTYLTDIWHKYKNDTDLHLLKIALLANQKLIETYKDSEALQQRLEIFKQAITKQSSQFLRVESIPDFDNINYFTLDIFKSGEKKFTNIIKKHLEFCFEKTNDAPSNKLINYSFKIVFEHYMSIRFHNEAMALITDLSKFVRQEKYKTSNTRFLPILTNLELTFAEQYNRHRSIQQSINKYNTVKAKTYLPIYNDRDLFMMIKEIVEVDIPRFVHREGFFRVFRPERGGKLDQNRRPSEDQIQKTLCIQIENILLKKGVRNSDISREEELYDGKRIDLVVKYGFVKPVVIEVKLLHNPDIKNKENRAKYKSKLIDYMVSKDTSHGIYLVFRVENIVHDFKFNQLKKEYADIKGLYIPDVIDCVVKSG